VCDLETSRMGAPYIYDISHLRVNLFCKFNVPALPEISFASRKSSCYKLCKCTALQLPTTYM